MSLTFIPFVELLSKISFVLPSQHYQARIPAPAPKDAVLETGAAQVQRNKTLGALTLPSGFSHWAWLLNLLLCDLEGASYLLLIPLLSPVK